MRDLSRQYIRYKHIYKLHNNGVSRDELAQKFNVTRTCINQILRIDLTKYDLRFRENQERNKQIIKQLKDGVSCKKVSKQYGVSRSTIIYSIAPGHFEAIRKRREERNKKVFELLKQGKQKEEVAKLFGISAEHVREIGIKYGMPTATRAEVKKRAELIIQLLKKGKTYAELAEQFNFHPASVYHIAHKAGLKTPFQKLIAKRNADVIMQLKKGVGTKKLAAKYNIGRMAIVVIANKLGLRIKPPSRRPRIEKMLKQGMKASTIAKELGITREAVYAVKWTPGVKAR